MFLKMIKSIVLSSVHEPIIFIKGMEAEIHGG